MGSTVQQSLFVIWVGSHQGDTWRYIASHDQDCFVSVQLGCCADQGQYLRWLTSPWPWGTGQGQGRGKHTGSLQPISRLPSPCFGPGWWSHSLPSNYRWTSHSRWLDPGVQHSWQMWTYRLCECIGKRSVMQQTGKHQSRNWWRLWLTSWQ